MAKVGELRDLGFNWRTTSQFASSIRITPEHVEDRVYIEYRPGKAISLKDEDDVDFKCFYVEIYGSSINKARIHITSLSDIRSFIMFFNQ